MLNNVGEIYDYCNNNLLDNELYDVSDIINYLNEAQSIICQKSPLEAKTNYTLDSTHKFTLPTDWLSTEKIMWLKLNATTPIHIEPDEVWMNEVILPLICTQGTIYLYYYKKPTELTVTRSQIPDIDARYNYSLASYAAEMFKLRDDDLEIAEQFRQRFMRSLDMLQTQKGNINKVKNIW